MGKVTGFLEIKRQDRGYAKPAERLKHWHEFTQPFGDDELKRQGARCMNCGVPFCHQGCPVNNIIPEWNHQAYRGDWRRGLAVLHSTNNFPEFTGRVCPAPCEASCTLNINDDPVTIKSIECSLVDRGWEEGWIGAETPLRRTGKKVAIVGSGPAGLAAAQQLARAGHLVTVFEKAARIGGLLRYGIPDFKLDKDVIDRRVGQMRAEGVEFRLGVHVGVDLKAAELLRGFDAVLLAGGAEAPRDVPVPGRDLGGIHYAMDYLAQSNRRVGGEAVGGPDILASGKHVVVLGGGDTGSDCVGTANRQGARSVTQLEILSRPPEVENKSMIWPDWPVKLRTSSSHEEGCAREWSVATKAFEGEGGRVKALRAVRVAWQGGKMRETPGSEFTLPADLVFIAAGFTGPVKAGLLADLGLALDERGNVRAGTDSYRTSLDKVFSAGDMRRGQSLVVWAIREGRQAARAIDEFLMGSSDLPR
ncbi:MAG: glutamate synthase subunit beta [Alphaproteobacteria bacterium]|nr:glutamate synthase subunit beta [Alphaproteobacteria bacterium]